MVDRIFCFLIFKSIYHLQPLQLQLIPSRVAHVREGVLAICPSHELPKHVVFSMQPVATPRVRVRRQEVLKNTFGMMHTCDRLSVNR